MKQFFGDEFVRACDCKNFSGRRANKALMQSVEYIGRENDQLPPLVAYHLASIMRSHKLSYGNISNSTDIYLHDANFSGLTPEFVINQMWERGVCSFVTDVMLKQCYGSRYTQLTITQQTDAIRALGISPIQASKMLQQIQRMEDRAVETVIATCQDSSNLEKALNNIALGHGIGKDGDNFCLLKALGKECAHKDRQGWLLCSLGHSYLSTINGYTKEYTNCPYCSNRELLTGFNDLQTVFPAIVDVWDFARNEGRSPNQVIATANTTGQLICPSGHSYKATINAPAQTVSNCPYCNNRELLTEFNDLQTTFPKIVTIWDYDANATGPDKVIALATTVGWLRCVQGHSYQAVINGQTNEITTCPYCNNRELLTGFNDLLTVFPDIQDKWDYNANQIAPDLILALNKVKAFVYCSAKHSYLATIFPYKHKISECPYCNGQLPVVGETDLTTTNPELCERWNYEDNPKRPELYFPSSSVRVSWKCEHGHVFRAPIQNMAINFRCPACEKNIRRNKRK